MHRCKGLNCFTPRRVAARFLSAFKRWKVKRILGQGKQEDNDVAPLNRVIDRPDSPSERCRREANFNVGIGCFLLQLAAETKNELQKMTELRIQMESVLVTVKDELRNKDILVANKLESNHGVEEGSELNSNLRSNKVLFDQSLKSDDVPKAEDCFEGMDRLEAELEAELERLQLHLDSDKLSIDQPQENIEESTAISSARSYSISNGEVIDPTIYGEEENRSGLHSGVPPYELERRLHELLETSQEQKIRKLEVALASAKQELREKEKETSWWKNTAQLKSRHVQGPPRLNFQQYGQHTHHLR